MLLQKLMDRVAPEPNSGCWLWVGPVNQYGYGRYRLVGARHQVAHRVSYEALVGPIPSGLQLDHKCRVRCCVNPDHLEPVTPAENVRRAALFNRPKRPNLPKGLCPVGHPMSGGNVYRRPNGRSDCRECMRASRRRWNRSDSRRASQAKYLLRIKAARAALSQVEG